MRTRLLVMLLMTVLLGAAAAADPPEAALRFEGKQVRLTPEGNLGRFYTEADIPQELDALLARPAPATQNVWQARAFIFRATDADWEDAEGKKHHTTAAMADADVEGLRRAAAEFARGVEAYSGRRLRLDLQVRVLDAPLTKVSGAKGQYLAWSEVTDPHIGPFVPEGEIDSVLVFWIPKDIQLGTYWGGTVGGCYKGAGYSSIAYVHPGKFELHAYFEVALHEWLHQAEWARGERMGYADLPDLHMAMQLGYPPDATSRGWMDWYRDFMGIFFSPRAWARMRMGRGDPDRRGPTGAGGFCREWLVLGPFPNEGDAGLDRAFFDEAHARPDAGAEAGGKVWTAVTCGDDVCDLWARLAPHDDVVAYLHAYVEAPEERAAVLWLGSDDGVKAWWNGRRVHQRHVHRGCTRDQDRVEVRLRPGWNRLLLKVDQGGGAWGACARLTDAAGHPLDLRWRARRPEAGIVADDAGPVTPPAVEVPGRAWAGVEDDPWFKLPQWGEPELRAATGLPGLALTGGEAALLLDPGADRSGARRRVDPDEAALDNQLSFAREAIAVVPCADPQTSLYLVRPDAAPFFAARCADPAPAFLAWCQFGRRPAFIVRAAVAPPRRELALFVDRAGGIELDLRAPRALLVAGTSAVAAVEVVNHGDKPVRVEGLTLAAGPGLTLGDGAPPDFEVAPGRPAVAEWALHAPPEVAAPTRVRLVATARIAGRDFRDVDVVDLRAPWELRLATADGRPIDRALRGATHPLVAHVTNNLDQRVRGILRVAAPAGWLAPDRADQVCAVNGMGETAVDLPLALPESWDGTTEVRVTVEPEPAAAARLGLRPLAAAVPLAAAPWCLVGPFSNQDRRGFATAYPPELGGDLATEMDGANGRVRAFDAAPAERVQLGHVDLRPLFPPGEWLVAYAHLCIEAGAEQRAVLHLGSDDTITAWWNGERVLAKDVYRPAAPDQDQVPVLLRKGPNQLLLKVCQGGGGWEFYFGLTDPRGKPIDGLVYRAR